MHILHFHNKPKVTLFRIECVDEDKRFQVVGEVLVLFVQQLNNGLGLGQTLSNVELPRHLIDLLENRQKS